MIYYKISEEELLAFMKDSYMLECARSYDPEFDLTFQEAFDSMPADEEIIESINSGYEICK